MFKVHNFDGSNMFSIYNNFAISFLFKYKIMQERCLRRAFRNLQIRLYLFGHAKTRSANAKARENRILFATV